MNSLTSEQNAAVKARGNVLVAAGAGTGKTSTVIERCLDLVIREGCRLDEILMVTFTEAAAAEMRERLGRKLREQADVAAPGSELAIRLTEEVALLGSAPISTLHSFCLDLVRRNFHRLALDPQFTVLDDQQTQPLTHRVLDELFEQLYSGTDDFVTAVKEFIRAYGGGRDGSIRKLLVQIHRHAHTLPSPAAWYEQQRKNFAETSATSWRKLFLTGVLEWAELWRETIKVFARGSSNARLCAQALDELLAKKDFASAAATVQRVVEADKMKWDQLKKDFRDPIKPFFTDAEMLRDFVEQDGSPLEQDWSWSREHMLTLTRLAAAFTQAYAQAKRELGGVDFSDQEQLALRLLYDETGQPTATALECRERFRHVFVDECQDINAAQDAILRAVSRKGPDGNRFLVGDVKQSIYRFRLADPRIFQNYESSWKRTDLEKGESQQAISAGAPSRSLSRHQETYPDQLLLPAFDKFVSSTTSDVVFPANTPTERAGGQVISLTENFRSRETLLRFVNSLFGTLMHPVIGGLRYDASTELRFGDPNGRSALALAPVVQWNASGGKPESGRVISPNETQHPSPQEIAPRVELHVITKEGEFTTEELENEPADLSATEREAWLVVNRLKVLKAEGHRVWDASVQQFRVAEYGDMVVLMRGVSGRAEVFAMVFHQAGVPLQVARGGFLQSIEVSDLWNLLRLLDNPLQDIPLLAVLRSPLVGLSGDELVALRMAEPRELLWVALRKVAAEADGQHTASGNPLGEKAAWFLRHWQMWRELIRHSSISHCLETALGQTHYEALLLADERGPARVANVQRLIELARRFDPYQREGLHRFLQFIEEQEEAEVMHEPAPLESGDAVRLMSIHASKGLEFPIVVLAGMGARFNLRDLGGDVLLNEELGLCPKVVPPESRQRYPSIAHWVASQHERRALLGEEMRLLYVALTRARDTLILTGTASRKKEFERWHERAPITDHALVKAGNYLDWLRLWFVQDMQPESWSTEHGGANELLRWEFHGQNADIFDLHPVNGQEAIGVLSPPSEDELAAIEARARWRYPDLAATSEPAKASVTLLRRRAMESDEESAPTFSFQRAFPRRSRTLSATDIGNAHHEFLQLVSFSEIKSQEAMRQAAARFQAEGRISGEAVAALDFDALTDFWKSELGTKLQEQRPETIHRELPFTARLTAADLRRLNLPLDTPGLRDDEFLVVQGVVDLAVVRDNEIWLVDFKTDAITAAELSEKTRTYEPQLKLYALALARIYRRPVAKSWLHFLTLRRAVAVKPPQ